MLYTPSPPPLPAVSGAASPRRARAADAGARAGGVDRRYSARRPRAGHRWYAGRIDARARLARACGRMFAGMGTGTGVGGWGHREKRLIVPAVYYLFMRIATACI